MWIFICCRMHFLDCVRKRKLALSAVMAGGNAHLSSCTKVSLFTVMFLVYTYTDAYSAGCDNFVAINICAFKRCCI